MDKNKIIEYYNDLDNFAQNKIDKELIDLMNAKNESRNYCIKYVLNAVLLIMVL